MVGEKYVKTDIDKLKFVEYRYRKNLYLKDHEFDLKLTEYQSPLAKRVHLLSYKDIFYNRCIVLDETTVHIRTNSVNNGCSFSNEHFPFVAGNKTVI